MRHGRLLAFLLFAVATGSAAAQTVAAPGDVLMTSRDGTDAVILVFDGEGTYKGDLVRLPEAEFSDLLFWNGIIYVGSRFTGSIERFTASGQSLGALSPDHFAIPNFLSPGPGGTLLAAGAADLYEFSPGGSLLWHRAGELPAGGGIDLGSDGCTLFFATGMVGRWDACLHDTPTFFSPRYGGGADALRVLSDGTFLVAVVGNRRVLHLDAAGNLMRDYDISGRGIALDPDGASFWTVDSCLRHVDIATGAILSSTCRGGGFAVAVVGEPRAGFAAAGVAPVPAASTVALAVIAATLGALALLRIRAMSL
jgi:hypothetical protein